MFRRIISILLALCMLFSAVLCFADEIYDDDDDWGDDDDTGDVEFDDGYEEEEQKVDFKTVSTYGIKTLDMDDFSYKLTDDGTGAVLTSYKGEASEVTFPAAVDNDIPVIAIDTGMCQSNPVIVSIEIPGSIQSIGNNAFAMCPNLKSVVIGEGLIELGLCCFGGCAELESIQLPDSLETVNDFVFARCAKLQEVVFGSKLQSIGKQAFLGCIELSRVVLPGGDGVSIGEQAFIQCADDFEIVY